MIPPRGMEKYRAEVPHRDYQVHPLVQRAEQIPIQEVLKDLFHIYVPTGLSGSVKIKCPFGWEHSDGGISAAMRVYPSNSCHCFASLQHGYFGPVKLVALHKGWSYLRSAKYLLGQRNLLDEDPYWVKFPKLVQSHELARRIQVSPQHAVEALQTALGRLSTYESRQYDEDVLQAVESVLEDLDCVIRAGQEGGVRTWLSRSVLAVSAVL